MVLSYLVMYWGDRAVGHLSSECPVHIVAHGVSHEEARSYIYKAIIILLLLCSKSQHDDGPRVLKYLAV